MSYDFVACQWSPSHENWPGTCLAPRTGQLLFGKLEQPSLCLVLRDPQWGIQGAGMLAEGVSGLSTSSLCLALSAYLPQFPQICDGGGTRGRRCLAFPAMPAPLWAPKPAPSSSPAYGVTLQELVSPAVHAFTSVLLIFNSQLTRRLPQAMCPAVLNLLSCLLPGHSEAAFSFGVA